MNTEDASKFDDLFTIIFMPLTHESFPNTWDSIKYTSDEAVLAKKKPRTLECSAGKYYVYLSL